MFNKGFKLVWKPHTSDMHNSMIAKVPFGYRRFFGGNKYVVFYCHPESTNPQRTKMVGQKKYSQSSKNSKTIDTSLELTDRLLKVLELIGTNKRNSMTMYMQVGQ